MIKAGIDDPNPNQKLVNYTIYLRKPLIFGLVSTCPEYRFLTDDEA